MLSWYASKIVNSNRNGKKIYEGKSLTKNGSKYKMTELCNVKPIIARQSNSMDRW